MTTYIHAPSGTYPLTENDVRQRESNTSFPVDMKPADVVSLGYYPVPQATPTFDSATQTATELAPSMAGGIWTQQWSITALDPATIAAKQAAQMQLTVGLFTVAIQQRLDTFARTKTYDNMASLVTYVGDPDPVFDKEGTYGKGARSATWRAAATLLAEVEAGTRAVPTLDEVIAALPTLEWPS